MHLTFRELAAASCGRLMNAEDGSVDAVLTDSRRDLKRAMFLAIPGERFDGHDFLQKALEQGAELLCIEEASLAKLPQGAPALVVKSTNAAYLDIARFWKHRIAGLFTVALSGSCGKTSTKEMLRSIFAAAYGENAVLATEGNTNNAIGVPYNLLNLEPRHKVCVIETGTNHFGEIAPLARTIEPDAALIVSIARCHLENLLSLEGVAHEKSDLFRFLRPGGLAVVPADCPQKDLLKEAVPENCRTFSAGHANDSSMDYEYLGGNMEGSSFLLKHRKTGESVQVNWSLSGVHQAANAALAAELAFECGIALPVIAEGLKNCRLPGLRMKKSEHFGATWLNDAYNANPDSMKATLQWLSEFAVPAKTLPVLGDMLEVGENGELVHREILEFALRLFPGAKILAVGPMMSAAAGKIASSKIIAFPDSAACSDKVREFVPQGGIVFLKASHGTHLEKVEPA